MDGLDGIEESLRTIIPNIPLARPSATMARSPRDDLEEPSGVSTWII
jgi:hypothetical protein